MIEGWKDITGYEGIYQVSSWGRVRSVDRKVRMVSKKGRELLVDRKGRVLKQFYGSSGYLQVCLCKEAHLKSQMVHRLVAKAFLTPVYGKLEVNHINGEKEDNSIANLEWCNSAENKRHAYKTGLRPTGKDHHFSKLARDELGMCIASGS